MAFAQWDESYSVGVAALDEQHKTLFGMVDQLYNAMAGGQARETLGGVLERLIQYTARHFEHEEMLMAKAKYPGLETHKGLHGELTRKVLDFQAKFRAGEVALSVELLSFLQDWLKHHILGTDRAYGPALTGS